MATRTSCSPSICYFSSNGRNCQYLHFPDCYSFNLPLIKGQCKIKNPNYIFQFGAKYEIYKSVCRRSKFQVKASANEGSPSSPWKKWLLGILLSVILPALGHKGGLFVVLKSKINAAVKTVETVTEMVEEVAEEVEKVEEKLPQESNLKEALKSIDNLAKKAVKEAEQAEELVHKVQEVEEKIEGAMMKAKTDEKKRTPKRQVPRTKIQLSNNR